MKNRSRPIIPLVFAGIWWIGQQLVGDAVFGWINEQISHWFGLPNPSMGQVANFGIRWGVPVFLILLAFYMWKNPNQYYPPSPSKLEPVKLGIEKTRCQQFKGFMDMKLNEADALIKPGKEIKLRDIEQWKSVCFKAIHIAIGENLFLENGKAEWQRQRGSSPRRERIRELYKQIEGSPYVGMARVMYESSTSQETFKNTLREWRGLMENLCNRIIPEDLLPGFDPKDLKLAEK